MRKSHTYSNPIRMGHDGHSYPTRRTHVIFKDACKFLNINFGLMCYTKCAGRGDTNDCAMSHTYGLSTCVWVFSHPFHPFVPCQVRNGASRVVALATVKGGRFPVEHWAKLARTFQTAMAARPDRFAQMTEAQLGSEIAQMALSDPEVAEGWEAAWHWKLFGVGTVKRSGLQIFRASDWFAFVMVLARQQMAGRPTVATMKLKTVSNPTRGIRAGRQITLTIMAITMPPIWQEKVRCSSLDVSQFIVPYMMPLSIFSSCPYSTYCLPFLSRHL